MAQLAEQLTCNQQVNGSSPLIGFVNGEVSEWFKELVLKTSDTARYRGFESHLLRHNRNIKKICSAKTPILSGFFAAQTPGFGDAYS